MFKLISTLIICLFCIPTHGSDLLDTIKKDGVLKIGIDVGYQPFEMKTRSGQIIGFDIDLANMIASELGVKLEIINTEWDGVIAALLAGKFHLVMGGMTITPDRSKRVDFSPPYLDMGQLPIIHSKHKSTIQKIEDLNQEKYTVASRLGTTGERAAKKFFPKAKYKSYQDRETGAMDVIFGRIDAFIYDSPYIHVFNNTKGGGKTFTFESPFTDEPIGLAIKKENPKFLAFLTNFIHKVKASPDYQERIDYWFKGSKWLKDL